MVRLMPMGYLKIIQADSFSVNYTGAEANVLVSLAKFGIPTNFVTKLPKTEITEAILNKLSQYRVGIERVIHGGERVGLYYLERGASQRPSKIVYDRKYSAVSMASRDDFDWDTILEDAAWFHFSGITAALGDELPSICEDACKAARRKGAIVSCDLNYRRNLWTPETAQSVMRRLATYANVLIGNEEDAEKCLGMAPENTNVIEGTLDCDAYCNLARSISETFGVNKIAFTLRTSLSASDNKWAAILYQDGEVWQSKEYLIHLVDRVGGGDSFSAGLIYAILKGYHAREAVEFAVAASCLKQTIEQDFNLSSVEDVRTLMNGDASGRVQR
jgi:2-dehydro-3-deoxygluconokinase